MASDNNSEQLISDEEQEKDDVIIIPDDSDSSVELEESVKKSGFKPLAKNTVFVATNDKDIWWDKLKEVVPKEEQCKIHDCKFAPQGHRNHPLFQRTYSVREIRLIIQYLIYYDDIHNGKGLRVWEDMHSRGYMQHRTVQSLNNNFKRILLRDISLYNLPRELEDKFLALRV